MMIPWKTVGTLAVTAVLVLAFAQIRSWQHDADVLKACTKAITAKDAPADVGKACPTRITVDHLVAHQAAACDAALSATPENTVAVEATCSLPVRRIQVERDVARGEAKRLTDTLNNERLGQDAALARASASATDLAERKARAAAALQAAPRDSDGLVVCDAQCMRARWGSAAERE